MQRKDDRFEAKITINGIRKSFYGNTKVEVKNKVKSYLQKINNGFKETKKIKLNDYVEYWLRFVFYSVTITGILMLAAIVGCGSDVLEYSIFRLM